MKETARTFIAIETDPSVRQRAAELIAIFARTGAKVSWVQPQNLHLTLKFLDDIPLREIPEVSAAVADAATPEAPFDLEIRGAGAFPHIGRPKTLWLGVGPGLDLLKAIFMRLENGLAKVGYRKEPRRFAPHLTLGRVRDAGPASSELSQLVERHMGFAAGHIHVVQIVVVSSQLTSEGPIYDILSRSRLAGKT